MPVPRNAPLNLLRSAKTCFVLGSAAAAIGAYYWAAQHADLPGSEALRARWGTLTTRRGHSGNRTHRPRPTGPIDMSVLVLGAVVLTWRGAILRKIEGRQEV